MDEVFFFVLLSLFFQYCAREGGKNFKAQVMGGGGAKPTLSG